MPLTFKNWSEREAGHGTDLLAEKDLEEACNQLYSDWSQSHKPPSRWDSYLLRTEHRASLYIYTGQELAAEVAEFMCVALYQKDYDRVDIETFGPYHLIITIPDTELHC